jgi:hypothetical protein
MWRNISKGERIMAPDDRQQPLADRPRAEFERHLMGAYLAGAGHDVETLVARNDDHARHLLRRASEYASEKVSELSMRARYLAHAVPTPHLYE